MAVRLGQKAIWRDPDGTRPSQLGRIIHYIDSDTPVFQTTGGACFAVRLVDLEAA
jgi:hypothetical protein